MALSFLGKRWQRQLLLYRCLFWVVVGVDLSESPECPQLPGSKPTAAVVHEVIADPNGDGRMPVSCNKDELSRHFED